MTPTDPIPQILERLEKLERSLVLWRRVAGILVVVLAAVLVGRNVGGPDARAQETPIPSTEGAIQEGAAKDREPDHVRLAKQRLALSRRAIEIINAATRKNATMVNQRDYLYRWSYRLLGDQIYLTLEDEDPRVPDPEVYLGVLDAKPSRERTLAFEAHRDRLLTWERSMRPYYERNILSAIDFMDIQSYRLEAELWLARERMKEKAAEREFGPQPKGELRDPATIPDSR